MLMYLSCQLSRCSPSKCACLTILNELDILFLNIICINFRDF